MRRRGRVPEQLDIPLVWEVEESSDVAPPAREEARRPANGAPKAVGGRLALAAVADAGVVLLFCAVTGLVARLAGAALNPAQLLAVAVAGVGIVSATAAAVVWAWRGTVGMLLMGVRFESPLGFSRAAGVWALWCLCLALAGVPVVLGLGTFERLAQSRLKYR